MVFMIIEKFRPGCLRELYRRLDERGRMLPGGVRYINSWIDQDLRVCYQVMEADAEAGIREWVRHWEDLVDFEIIPVISSAAAREKAMANG